MVAYKRNMTIKEGVGDMEILRSLKERCDPRLAALLVVDVQNDFVSPEGSAGKRGEDVSGALAMIPNLLALIEAARRVALTIVYIRTTHSEWTDTPSWIYRSSQKSGLSTCREGTWGAEFYEGISPRPSERVVIKHRYSAFINTDLNTILRARGIQSVLVCGVATNVCVETSARDAYMFDYYVTVIDDCSAAYDAKLHMTTLENVRRHFGLVASSAEIAEVWSSLARTAPVGL
jgi:ureidoacrylate peracid hydrolase